MSAKPLAETSREYQDLPKRKNISAKKKQPGNKKRKKSKWFYRIIICALVVGGIGTLLYPVVGKILSSRAQTVVIEDYRLSMAQINEEIIQKAWEKAFEYNRALTAAVKDGRYAENAVILSEYPDFLNDRGLIGHIEIPALNIRLPVYHGVSSDVLDKGIGHIANTALPLGKQGEHAVLSGHSGHPTSALFDDLHLLNLGDKFELFILDKKFTYEVDSINTVLPDDVSLLQPEIDHSYVTLVTCTPYGINSHRLLVRGEKTAEEKLLKAEPGRIIPGGEVRNSMFELLLIFIIVIRNIRTVKSRIKKRRKIQC